MSRRMRGFRVLLRLAGSLFGGHLLLWLSDVLFGWHLQTKVRRGARREIQDPFEQTNCNSFADYVMPIH